MTKCFQVYLYSNDRVSGFALKNISEIDSKTMRINSVYL